MDAMILKKSLFWLVSYWMDFVVGVLFLLFYYGISITHMSKIVFGPTQVLWALAFVNVIKQCIEQ